MHTVVPIVDTNEFGQMLEIPNEGRQTPLVSICDYMHPREATQPGSRGGKKKMRLIFWPNIWFHFLDRDMSPPWGPF